MMPKTRRSVAVLAGAAALCVCSLFQGTTQGAVPLPITPHSCAAAALGMLLGPVSGAGAVGIYCVAGVIAGFFGIRAFPSDLAGLAALSTLAGGEVTGYFFAAILAGICTRNVKPSDERAKAFPALVHGAIAGILCSAIPVVLAFRNLYEASFLQALRYAFAPALPANVIKMIIAIVVADVLRRPVGGWIEGMSVDS